MVANGDCLGSGPQIYPVYPNGEDIPRDAVIRVECRTDDGGCAEPTDVRLRRVAGEEPVPFTMACKPAYDDNTHCTVTPDQLLEEGELYELSWAKGVYDGFAVRLYAEPCGVYETPIPVLSEVRVSSITEEYCEGVYRRVSGLVNVPDAGDGSTILRVYEGEELVYTTIGKTHPTGFTYRAGVDKTEVCLYGVLEAGDGTLSAPSALACGDESGPTSAPADAPAPTAPAEGPSREECVNAPPTDTAAYESTNPTTEPGSDASATKSESGCSTVPAGRWVPWVFERRRY
jgi:hypothetical protein